MLLRGMSPTEFGEKSEAKPPERAQRYCVRSSRTSLGLSSPGLAPPPPCGASDCGQVGKESIVLCRRARGPLDARIDSQHESRKDQVARIAFLVREA